MFNAEKVENLSCIKENSNIGHSEDVKKKVLRYLSENKTSTVELVIRHFTEKKGISLDVDIVSGWLEHAKTVSRVSKSLDLRYEVVKFAKKNSSMSNSEIAKRVTSVKLEVTEHYVKD
jgi:hypothetical protein